MQFSTNILNILRIILAFRIVVASFDDNEPQFCQWAPFEFYAKKLCDGFCSGARGFFHPIAKRLICFEKKIPEIISQPKLGEANDQGLFSCECTHFTSIAIPCIKKLVYRNRTKEQCYESCNKYTVYIFEKNSRRSIYCQQASKVTEYNLQSLTWRNKHITKSGNSYYTYACQCGMNLNEEKWKEKESNFGNTIAETVDNGQMIMECQLEQLILPYISGKDIYCSEKCSRLMGYITDNDELLCFHRINSAVIISKKKSLCECGFRTRTHKSERYHCEPNLTFPNITNYDRCKFKCSEYIILRVFEDKKIKVLWCGKISNPNNIILSIDWTARIKENAARDLSSFLCHCGLSSMEKETLTSHIQISPQTGNKLNKRSGDNIHFSEVTSTDYGVNFKLNGNIYFKRIKWTGIVSSPPDEFKYACSSGSFKVNSKFRCDFQCRRAKAYFLPDNKNLICYHRVKNAIQISPFSDNKCECGIVLSKSKKCESTHPCIPKSIHPANNATHCFEICGEYKAYIFNVLPAQRVARCELKNYSPSRIFEGLSLRIGAHKRVFTKFGKASSEYPCECGLEFGSSDIDKDSKKNIQNSSHQSFRNQTQQNDEGKHDEDNEEDFSGERQNKLDFNNKRVSLTQNDCIIDEKNSEDEKLDVITGKDFSEEKGNDFINKREHPTELVNDGITNKKKSKDKKQRNYNKGKKSLDRKQLDLADEEGIRDKKHHNYISEEFIREKQPIFIEENELVYENHRHFLTGKDAISGKQNKFIGENQFLDRKTKNLISEKESTIEDDRDFASEKEIIDENKNDSGNNKKIIDVNKNDCNFKFTSGIENICANECEIIEDAQNDGILASRLVEPVEDMDTPFSFYHKEIETSESSRKSNVILPDLNIPFEISTMNKNSTNKIIDTCNQDNIRNYPPKKRFKYLYGKFSLKK